MFLIYNLNLEAINRISIKCSPEKFEVIIETESIIPAPYLARINVLVFRTGEG